MLPRISYLDAREMLTRQKEAILAKIRQVSRSHIVYRGRDVFPDETVTQVDPTSVPGLSELFAYLIGQPLTIKQRMSVGILRWMNYQEDLKEDRNT